jgi:hypothetical protein
MSELNDLAIRSSVVTQHALLQLLIKKGVFSKEEYDRAFDRFQMLFNRLAETAQTAARQNIKPDISSISQEILQELFGVTP